METLKVQQPQADQKLTQWNIDPSHSSIKFSVRHMLITNVNGQFTDFSGSLLMAGADLSKAKAAIEIKAASINTGDANRDGHLKSADFFDAEQFPVINFESTGFKSYDADRFQLTGNLSMHGITKEISLEGEYTGRITDPYGNERTGFQVHGLIDRFAFGLQWNALLETGGAMVGQNVKFQADIELIKQND